ncbi:ArnT family glycosyltransferase [Streptomyces cynarae]|uniref:ArnT family glycosyltransferase n=1 Tax=Streptomyces cynarae TaxID=2981134 RepID=UPI00406BF755
MKSIRSVSELTMARIAVLAAGLIMFTGKIRLAAATYGTGDVELFSKFTQAIGKVGPVDVYNFPFHAPLLYNHGPLTSYILALFSALVSHGSSFPLLIRLPACYADLVTCLLVFELSRERMGIRRAGWCGVAAALSPVLFGVSGFHGNTDPLFVALVLLSAWLLMRRSQGVACPAWAGVALGLALSVKTVPAVAVPALLICAFRAGRRCARFFCGGLLVTLAALWGPPCLMYPRQVLTHVLEYRGLPLFFWGPVAWGDLAGASHNVLTWWQSHGPFWVALASAGLGAWLAWRKPRDIGAAVGLAMAVPLLLSTVTADQYLSWAAAGVLIAHFWSGLAYNLVAGLFVAELYTKWNEGYPRGVALGRLWTSFETGFSAVVWVVLAIAVTVGTRAVLNARPENASTETGRGERRPSLALQKV